MTDLVKENAELKASLQATMDKLDAVMKNNGNLVREKRELQGKPPPVVGKTLDGVIVEEDRLIVPRAMASQPAQYRYWKENAAEQGKTLIISDPQRSAPQNADDLPNRIVADDRRTVYVKRDYLHGDGRIYREEKAAAERLGYRVVVFNSANQLPNEVLDDGNK